MQVIGEEFAVAWPDGGESYLRLEFLRKHCPCAGCGGEPIDLMGNYSRPTVLHGPKSFLLRTWRVVGSYALQPVWEDGHDSGLYTWRYLRKLGEKAEAEAAAPPPQAGGCCGGPGQAHDHEHGHHHQPPHHHDDEESGDNGSCCGGGGCSSHLQQQHHLHTADEAHEHASPAPSATTPRATPPPLPRQEVGS